jgi:hypothetical protein
MKNNLFEKFASEKFENLDAIRGGEVSGGRTKDAGATLSTNSEGCQQADVTKNDKTSDVGGPYCPDVAFAGVVVSNTGLTSSAFSVSPSSSSFFTIG